MLGHNLIAFDLPHLAAAKPDLRLLRYHELMRDLEPHQRHVGKNDRDPIHHHDYYDHIQRPTQALIDNPHLDEHTRDQLKQRLERQMVHVREWQREYKEQRSGNVGPSAPADASASGSADRHAPRRGNVATPLRSLGEAGNG